MEKQQGQLTHSLRAADDTKRNEIMPISESNNLAALMEALEYFYQKTKNRISYEYIAFERFNDSLEDAAKLVQLCRRKFPVRVNIIEYNPIEGAVFEKSDENQLNAFAAYLAKEGVAVTVRRSRGKDIDAACGQLANKGLGMGCLQMMCACRCCVLPENRMGTRAAGSLSQFGKVGKAWGRRDFGGERSIAKVCVSWCVPCARRMARGYLLSSCLNGAIRKV